MLLFKTFLSLIFIVSSAVDAKQLVRRDSGKAMLRFAARLNLDARTASGSTLPEMERARVRSMKRASHLSKRGVLPPLLPESVSIRSNQVNYAVTVGIGEPPHNYTLLIDTGSSNTFVGVNKNNPYVRTNTSIDTGHSFNATYGTGNITGEEWLDTVTLSHNLVIKNQSIAALNFSEGAFNGVDGIFGVGPVGLTTKTVRKTHEVPTVMDNLYAQGKISKESLGVYFVPTGLPNDAGELTFGGYDPTATTSTVNYVLLTKTRPASFYWGVNQTVSYDGQTILSNTAGIVDTGTTLTLLATDAFQKYQKLTGAVVDNTTGLLTISKAQYADLKTLSFNIGGTSYGLTRDAQTWPTSLNAAIGGDKNAIYLIISDAGTPSGSGLDFTNGYTWLQRFYTEYDTTNQRVGFATTAHTNSVVNYKP